MLDKSQILTLFEKKPEPTPGPFGMPADPQPVEPVELDSLVMQDAAVAPARGKGSFAVNATHDASFKAASEPQDFRAAALPASSSEPPAAEEKSIRGQADDAANWRQQPQPTSPPTPKPELERFTDETPQKPQ